MLSEIRKQIIKIEDTYSNNATKNKDAVRFKRDKEDIRLEFERDCDKIIHSHSYTRYIDKTQVHSNNFNDHISKRITHVQFVSRASRTIARALGLNEDLCEAISLGHDTGHTPFGHVGEKILNDISKRYTGENFMHNVQSVRDMMYIEKSGSGLNLTIQVLDGILCHNGEAVKEKYLPMKKTKEEFLEQYRELYKDEKLLKQLRPMTLEGCVARISDIIGYIGKDIEDGIAIGLLKREDLPDNIVSVLGNRNEDIMNCLIMNIIENSYNKPYISMSKDVYKALYELKEFNNINIYLKSIDDEKINQFKNMFEELFCIYLQALNNGEKENDVYIALVENMSDEYILNTSNERKVIDFMAGMTDRYILSQYEKYVLSKI